MTPPPIKGLRRGVGRVLFTGGARSGKSRAAESLVAELPAVYVATGPQPSSDPEWQQRVARHRARRPQTWSTVETVDLAPHIARATPDRPVLVDCLTLWLTARLDALDAWADPSAAEGPMTAEIEALASHVADSAGGVVLVTNEVGSGIVPPDPGARLFRDLLGVCNTLVADVCDQVHLVVAGHVLPLKRVGP